MSHTDPPMDPDYDYPALMRSRICGYDGGGHNHGHTDCWLFGEGAALIESQAAEIERLRGLLQEAHLHYEGSCETGCGWRSSGTQEASYAAHLAHVDALLNPKETP